VTEQQTEEAALRLTKGLMDLLKTGKFSLQLLEFMERFLVEARKTTRATLEKARK